MDSKLISLVGDVEDEAEAILQQARDQAAALRKEIAARSARQADGKKATAQNEAQALLQQSQARTQEELERGRASESETLSALLHRAEGRLAKAEKLILQELRKL